jgi:hypothetical protein
VGFRRPLAILALRYEGRTLQFDVAMPSSFKMHKLTLGFCLVFPALAGCGGSVEGVRVGSPETSKNVGTHAPLKGKIVADNSTSMSDGASDHQVDVAGFTTLPFPVDAPDANTANAELDRLQRANASVKSNWVPPGQDDRWGHAQVLVRAPLDSVRAQVTDYGHMKDLAPQKFKTSRIVDKHGALTDVYLQIPVLHGLVTLWQVVRFAPPEQVAPGLEVVQGALVKGNVKQLRIVITMRAVDPSRTVLTCDLLMTPEFIAPQAAVDEELRDAAQNAVDGVKDKAERAMIR